MAQSLLARSAGATARLAASSRAIICPRASFVLARSVCSAAAASPPICAPKTLSSSGLTAVRAMAAAAPRMVRAAAASGAALKEVAFEPETLPQVAVRVVPPSEWEGDLMVLAVTEEDFATEAEVTILKSETVQTVDATLGGLLAEMVAVGGFEGKQGSQSRLLRYQGLGLKAKYVVMVGLGKGAKLAAQAEWGGSAFQALGSAVATLAKSQKAASVAVFPLTPLADELVAPAVAQITTAAILGGYESSRFKSKKSPTASKLAELHLLVPESEATEAAVARGVAFARGNLLTRYLVEAPPNVCTPTHLADAAAHIAAGAPEVFSLKVYEKEDCEAMGMGCYLGVAEASAEPPKFIHLQYTPKGGVASRKIAIVGKGLTFDSGGYNLKAGPGSLIELMKFDMGGAGATLGAARILAELQPANVEIHFIIASCENMVAGAGLRPGDILKAASGKTVEVDNTDAEGRLTLADAMWFAQEKCGVSSMVDIATLTGACMVALGSSIAGLFTPSDKLAEEVSRAAKATGEKVWRMPMEDEYFEGMKSSVADMKNSGGRLGGAITAALFLKQFVNEGVEWAHVDVAGPVWNTKLALPTGYGAALLAEWAQAQAAAAAAGPAEEGK